MSPVKTPFCFAQNQKALQQIDEKIKSQCSCGLSFEMSPESICKTALLSA